MVITVIWMVFFDLYYLTAMSGTPCGWFRFLRCCEGHCGGKYTSSSLWEMAFKKPDCAGHHCKSFLLQLATRSWVGLCFLFCLRCFVQTVSWISLPPVRRQRWRHPGSCENTSMVVSEAWTRQWWIYRWMTAIVIVLSIFKSHFLEQEDGLTSAHDEFSR